ncbi:MAG: phenylalanyl-tRNA synthetase alpha chain [Saprospiraceae bacterium]|jgi:phenylalanyl-tRNA synthetase alpha chain|tara:strand:- start:512 stop:1525 length:1014 start_codon:yes stop_codon:yes gene_type:complete
MIEELEKLRKEISDFKAKSSEEIEQFRIKFLGRQGIFKELSANFRTVANEQKKEVGIKLNELKNLVQNKIENFSLISDSPSGESSAEDFTRSSGGIELGSRHPVSLIRREILDIFSRIGFSISEGPEIEDDWHVFEALNFPPEHPARDMQDTFFIEKDPDMMLRTHTSSVQARVMKNTPPPIRTVSPGRVFRNEAISSRSHCIFHQIEGLYIDKDVSFADLKQTLSYFTKEFFGKTEIRLRPSYFPFTEPSAEMDVYWGLETETDYRITKGTGWLEILGCGMVDPNVLANCGIDSNEYSGFAFGMGIERIAMLKYQIDDIRVLFENDVRVLNQFKGA